MGWIGCIRCEKIRHDFVAQTVALIALLCIKFHAVMKRSQMHPNTTKLTETCIYGPMQWTWCVRCENIRHDFVAWTLFTNCTSFSQNCTEIRIETKQSQMHPNTMILTKTWVYGPMGWTRCIRCKNVRHDFVAWTFFTNCSSSAQIALSFVQYQNEPKCTQTLRN